MELTLAQPSRRGREASEPADVLLLLLRRDDDKGGKLALVGCSDRSLGAVVGCEALLSPGVYRVLPLSLRPSSLAGVEPLPVVLRVGSARPMLCEELPLSPAEAASALGAYCRRGERRRAFDGMGMYTLADGAGFLHYAENASRVGRFTVQLDCAGSFNLLSSRGSQQTLDVPSTTLTSAGCAPSGPRCARAAPSRAGCPRPASAAAAAARCLATS